MRGGRRRSASFSDAVDEGGGYRIVVYLVPGELLRNHDVFRRRRPNEARKDDVRDDKGVKTVKGRVYRYVYHGRHRYYYVGAVAPQRLSRVKLCQIMSNKTEADLSLFQ